MGEDVICISRIIGDEKMNKREHFRCEKCKTKTTRIIDSGRTQCAKCLLSPTQPQQVSGFKKFWVMFFTFKCTKCCKDSYKFVCKECRAQEAK